MGTSSDFREIPFMPEWHLTGKIHLKFDTYHPQGMVKIGDRFYISSVQVIEKTTRIMNWKTKRDRTAGKGIAHLFEVDFDGNLIREMTSGERDMYHPGGIDFDGTFLWIPVAEYRPESETIFYKVQPESWQAVEAFRAPDHIGAVVYNRELQTVIGLSWDGAFFYEWTPEGRLIRKVRNELDDFAYQDCKYVEGPAMLCGGREGNAHGGIRLIDLLDFSTIRGIWSIPRTPKKTLMTRNPLDFEWVGEHLLYYFLPEDGSSDLYIYEVK